MSDATEGVTDSNTNAPAPDTEGDKQVETKTFTQDEVNRIVAERLAREKSKFDDELKQVQSSKDDQSKTELQKLQEQIEALTKENESNKLSALKSRISKDTGVPVELLTASDEESLTAQAAAITDYVESQSKSKKTETPKPGQPLKDGATPPASKSRDEILKEVMGR